MLPYPDCLLEYPYVLSNLMAYEHPTLIPQNWLWCNDTKLRHFLSCRGRKIVGRTFVSRPWQFQRDVQSPSALCARPIRRVQRHPGASRIADNGHPLLAGHEQLSLSNVETAMIMQHIIMTPSGLITYGLFNRSITTRLCSDGKVSRETTHASASTRGKIDQNAVNQTYENYCLERINQTGEDRALQLSSMRQSTASCIRCPRVKRYYSNHDITST